MAITGEELKRKRLELQMTQQDFAGGIGITREMLNMMETGKRGVSRATELLYNEFLKSEMVSHGTPKKTPDVIDQGEYVELLKKYNSILEERDQLKEQLNSLKKDTEDHAAWIYGVRRFVLDLAKDVRGGDLKTQSVILGKLEGEGYRLGEGTYTPASGNADKKHKEKSTVKSR